MSPLSWQPKRHGWSRTWLFGDVWGSHHHALRHTAVAAWLRSGASLYEANRWAGHASTTTTDRIYGHLLQPDGKVSEEVEKLFWPTEPMQMEERRQHRRAK